MGCNKHRHITETRLAMLFNGNAPILFGVDALASTVCIINRLPTTFLEEKSPFELLFHNHWISMSFVPLGVRFVLIYWIILIIKLLLAVFHVSFMGIALNTRGIGVSIWLHLEFIPADMQSLKRTHSLSQDKLHHLISPKFYSQTLRKPLWHCWPNQRPVSHSHQMFPQHHFLWALTCYVSILLTLALPYQIPPTNLWMNHHHLVLLVHHHRQIQTCLQIATRLQHVLKQVYFGLVDLLI